MDFMLIDAFAPRPFTGNPAVVLRLNREFPQEYLQQLAMEFNQAETATVRPLPDGHLELRWFTPTREVPMCGHATLAAAQAVLNWGMWDPTAPIRFVTRSSGLLTCRKVGSAIAMDFPATRPVPAACPPDIHLALGLPPSCPISCIGAAGMNLTFRLPDAQSVLLARPRMELVASYHPVGITITAPGAEPGCDFVSRFFAPAAGIPEDPVTGSAHCTLAVYWAAQLGKFDFSAVQLSARRGYLEVRLLGDRVELTGQAQLVARGVMEGASSSTTSTSAVR